MHPTHELRSHNDYDYHYPEHAPQFASLDDGRTTKPVSIRLNLSGDMFLKVVPYPVVVESWDKKKQGRHKRRWEATFTQAERRKISSYHGRFYRWYLVTGTPRQAQARPRTIELLQRAVNFFAEC